MVTVRYLELESSQAIFKACPMKNMYSLYRIKSGLWLYEGRSDNAVVLSNGEKIDSVTIEGIGGIHLDVSAALIIGSSRFQFSLLVEAKEAATTPARKVGL